MILGIDVSTYLEELEHGAKYFKEDKQIDPIDAFVDNGISCMRIRLWVRPYSDDGEPYLAGTNDLDAFFRLARIAKLKGMDIMLDIHYSDFWADPGKQTIPKDWSTRNLNELCDLVYDYTKNTLDSIKSKDIRVKYIQIGNEITNGLLWPVGQLIENSDGSRGNYDNLIKLLKSGIKGAREVMPQSELVLHLERSYDQKIYNEFFNNMKDACVDFDIIGMSYYPYWHGTFEQYFDNVDNLKKFGKKIMTVELGYAFTLEDYIKDVGVGGAQLVVSVDNVDNFDFVHKYPISKEGQASFVKDFLSNAVKHNVDGVFWWEPLWIPGEGICWASNSAKVYTGETHKESCRNEWANQCLFDYSGVMLPSFNEFKIEKPF